MQNATSIYVPRRDPNPITLGDVITDEVMDQFHEDAEAECRRLGIPIEPRSFHEIVRMAVVGRLKPQDRMIYIEEKDAGCFPTVSKDSDVQVHYELSRMAGTAHALAEMFALGQAPGVRTDNTFMHGHCNGNQFEKNPEQGDFYKGMAHGAGVNITGAVYKSGLARFPGDPEAWVRGSGDVRRICEDRGWQCEGDVKVRASPVCDPGPAIDVANDIVDQRVLANVVENPDLERRPIDELRAEAKSQLLPD